MMTVQQLHQIFIPVLVLAFSSLIGMSVKNILNRLRKVENDNSQIKENYIDRFEKVREEANSNKEEILLSIADLKIKLEREFVRK